MLAPESHSEGDDGPVEAPSREVPMPAAFESPGPTTPNCPSGLRGSWHPKAKVAHLFQQGVYVGGEVDEPRPSPPFGRKEGKRPPATIGDLSFERPDSGGPAAPHGHGGPGAILDSGQLSYPNFFGGQYYNAPLDNFRFGSKTESVYDLPGRVTYREIGMKRNRWKKHWATDCHTQGISVGPKMFVASCYTRNAKKSKRQAYLQFYAIGDGTSLSAYQDGKRDAGTRLVDVEGAGSVYRHVAAGQAMVAKSWSPYPEGAMITPVAGDKDKGDHDNYKIYLYREDGTKIWEFTTPWDANGIDCCGLFDWGGRHFLIGLNTQFIELWLLLPEDPQDLTTFTGRRVHLRLKVNSYFRWREGKGFPGTGSFPDFYQNVAPFRIRGEEVLFWAGRYKHADLFRMKNFAQVAQLMLDVAEKKDGALERFGEYAESVQAAPESVLLDWLGRLDVTGLGEQGMFTEGLATTTGTGAVQYMWAAPRNFRRWRCVPVRRKVKCGRFYRWSIDWSDPWL